MMASDMRWTTDLDNAFLAQQQDVMDAVQRMPHTAWDYGYLRTNPQVIIRNGPYIEIVLADPVFVVVPYYYPLVVYGPPRPQTSRRASPVESAPMSTAISGGHFPFNNGTVSPILHS